jgi:hypothetical protein
MSDHIRCSKCKRHMQIVDSPSLTCYAENCDGLPERYTPEYENDITRNCYAWDKAAEAAGFDLSKHGNVYLATGVLGAVRPTGPRKHASPQCKSGKRDYCTCDGCF